MLKNRVMPMEARLFPHLLKNEPKAVELTKKEYEDYRSIKQFRASGESDEDAPEAVGQDTGEQAESSFQGTKAEAEKILLARGISKGQLRGKRRAELIDML